MATRTHTHTAVDLCANCEHPRDWHRLDDSTNVSPTDPAVEFRCIGYDCEKPGQSRTDGFRDGCDKACPDYRAPT